MAAVAEKRKPEGEEDAADFGIRKRLKLSDLPLTSTKRADIEALVQKMKKKGHFDVLRRQGYAKFEGGDSKHILLSALEGVVDSETTRDPTLLAKDRRIAAPLIEGTAERSDVYRAAEDSVNQFVQELLVEAERHLRQIRRQDVGEDAAIDEQQKGSKTNEDWDREAAERRQARIQAVEEEKETQRKKDREERRKAEEEKRRQREEEEAREKERQEREEKRRAEREAERERERERERKRREEYEKEQQEFEREREERRERRRREDRERDRDRDERHERERQEDRERRRRRVDQEAKSLPPEREKELEEAALMELLKEGQALAKTRQRAELEVDEALAPPPRKTLVPKSIKPQDPVAARLAKIPSKSPAKVDGEEATDSAIPNAHAHNDRDGDEHMETRRQSQDGAASPAIKATSRADEGGDQSPYIKLSRDKMLDATRRQSLRPEDDRPHGHGSHRERSRSRESRYRDNREARRRSRSPVRRRDEDRSYRSRRSPDEPDRRKRSRSRDPPDIDRYVPSSGRRADDDRDKRRDDRDRDRDRERARDDRPRDRERGRDRDERPRERDRDDRPRERDRERERDRDDRDDRRASHSARDARDDRPKYNDIDRYVPGSGSSARKDDDRDRAKDRDRERDRDRDRRRERSRSRERDRDGGRRRRSRSR